MKPRFHTADPHNPLVHLPAAQELREYLQGYRDVQARLCQLLRELGAQADRQAEHCWQKQKPPMAAYWKAVAVYARHVARSLHVPRQEERDSSRANRSDRDGHTHLWEPS